MKLYSYWRSTTSYRVRIALNLKGVAYETIPVDLVSGAQHDADYVALNPGHGVPTLVTPEGQVLRQSMAILEWLEERHPTPALLPQDAGARAEVRAAAQVIATDVHPVNNLRVVHRLRDMGHSGEETTRWMNDWMGQGFTAFAAMIRPDTAYCFGDAPGLADLCLVPQLYNAHRWGLDLAPFARLTEIETRCLARPEFADARPEVQPDAT
ncbi:maleylacetoacetate isomerase [Phaeobacter sp. HF9A]|uniref:maleylacetoacetate isomerase n=1 Tax=Phaeobacter sp. HF9A TaxID=2721561 RepID=UPI001430C07F|nr:maleylacetoacetate isomerase [Phaeobacter sp. HF9A]NIZ12322.1 maleylacetoacetate isomerase [Phaeobacter sp. HF9A]